MCDLRLSHRKQRIGPVVRDCRVNAGGLIDCEPQFFSDDAKKMQLIGRLPFALLFFRLFLKAFMRKYPPEGWTIEWKQNSRDGIRFDMTTCFYDRTLSDLGAPELTAAFCRVDDLMYGPMSRYVSWQRSTTIASGGTHCDFCFASTRHLRHGPR